MRAAIALALACAATTAGADTTGDARRYFDAGRQAYEAGQYAVSVAAFEEARRLAPRPSIDFALAQAYRRQYSVDHDGDKLVRAGTLFREYLVAVRQGERREEATRLLGEIEPLLVRLEQERARSAPRPAPPVATQLMVSSQTKGARGSIDGGPLSDIPVIADVAPGPHRVRVAADGFFEGTAEAVAVDGRLVVSEIQLVERPAQLAITAPGADVSIDGKPAGHRVSIPAGKHFIAATRRGRAAWTTEVVVERGQSQALTADLPRTKQRAISYGVFAGAGALAIAGGIAAGLDLSARSGADRLAARIDAGRGTTDDLAEHNRLADRANRWASRSQLMFGGAAAVGIAGALLYYFDVPRPAGGAIVPAAASDSVGAAWLRTF